MRGPVIIAVPCCGEVHHLSVEIDEARNLNERDRAPFCDEKWIYVEAVDHDRDLIKVGQAFGTEFHETCDSLAGSVIHNVLDQLMAWNDKNPLDDVTVIVAVAVSAIHHLPSPMNLMHTEIARETRRLVEAGATSAEEVYRWWAVTGSVSAAADAIAQSTHSEWFDGTVPRAEDWMARDGVTPAQAKAFDLLGFSPGEWDDWSSNSFAAGETLDWLRSGIRLWSNAMRIRDSGVAPKDVSRFAETLGLAPMEAARWASRFPGHPEVAAEWLAAAVGYIAAEDAAGRGIAPDTWSVLISGTSVPETVEVSTVP